jgi:predicted transglutaminase-like cysteine proteinase
MIKKIVFALLVVFLVGCEFAPPRAKTMETGSEVMTPQQYKEMCERIPELCPPEEDEEDGAAPN